MWVELLLVALAPNLGSLFLRRLLDKMLWAGRDEGLSIVISPAGGVGQGYVATGVTYSEGTKVVAEDPEEEAVMASLRIMGESGLFKTVVREPHTIVVRGVRRAVLERLIKRRISKSSVLVGYRSVTVAAGDWFSSVSGSHSIAEGVRAVILVDTAPSGPLPDSIVEHKVKDVELDGPIDVQIVIGSERLGRPLGTPSSTIPDAMRRNPGIAGVLTGKISERESVSAILHGASANPLFKGMTLLLTNRPFQAIFAVACAVSVELSWAANHSRYPEYTPLAFLELMGLLASPLLFLGGLGYSPRPLMKVGAYLVFGSAVIGSCRFFMVVHALLAPQVYAGDDLQRVREYMGTEETRYEGSLVIQYLHEAVKSLDGQANRGSIVAPAVLLVVWVLPLIITCAGGAFLQCAPTWLVSAIATKNMVTVPKEAKERVAWDLMSAGLPPHCTGVDCRGLTWLDARWRKRPNGKRVERLMAVPRSQFECNFIWRTRTRQQWLKMRWGGLSSAAIGENVPLDPGSVLPARRGTEDGEGPPPAGDEILNSSSLAGVPERARPLVLLDDEVAAGSFRVFCSVSEVETLPEPVYVTRTEVDALKKAWSNATVHEAWKEVVIASSARAALAVPYTLVDYANDTLETGAIAGPCLRTDTTLGQLAVLWLAMLAWDHGGWVPAPSLVWATSVVVWLTLDSEALWKGAYDVVRAQRLARRADVLPWLSVSVGVWSVGFWLTSEALRSPSKLYGSHYLVGLLAGFTVLRYVGVMAMSEVGPVDGGALSIRPTDEHSAGRCHRLIRGRIRPFTYAFRVVASGEEYRQVHVDSEPAAMAKEFGMGEVPVMVGGAWGEPRKGGRAARRSYAGH